MDKNRKMRVYGISEESYNSIRTIQKGRCKICKMPENIAKGKNLVIDHDHKSGQVRGLLCKNCNAGIGMLGDSTKRLLRAAIYVINKNKPNLLNFCYTIVASAVNDMDYRRVR